MSVIHCLNCNYNLCGTPCDPAEGFRCPECGRAFDPACQYTWRPPPRRLRESTLREGLRRLWAWCRGHRIHHGGAEGNQSPDG